MTLPSFATLGPKMALAIICLLIFGAMIVAAFWPFTFHPANHVTWLRDENGLRFDGGGIALSPKSLEFSNSQSPAGASLEIWLEPSQEKYSTALLSFSSPENPEQFRLRQAGSYLLILQQPSGSSHHSGVPSLWVSRAFQANKRRFISMSSGTDGTRIYMDGIPAEKSPTFKLTQKDFSGQLIVGTSPVAYDTWRGKLLGVVLFNREVTPAQVSEHYQAWLKGQPEIIKNDQPVALYSFRERVGNLVHNQIPSGPDLVIPKNFSIPYKPFLKAPWNEFSPTRAYVQEVLINIVGFVPFGFFLCMYFSWNQTSRKAVCATIILGAAFSFTIEFLQRYIPMRDSGITDIFTNTLGTVIGAVLCRWGMLYGLLGKPETRTAREQLPAATRNKSNPFH